MTESVNNIPLDVIALIEDRKTNNDTDARYAKVQRAMSPLWQSDMATRLNRLVSEPSSAKSKLPKFYELLSLADEKRSDQVACKRGCDACCHMRVEISDVEANHISFHTGFALTKLGPGRHTTPIHELGRPDTPCPFLVDHECSIYDVRPFVCRDMAVFDVDALSCSFENMTLSRDGDHRAMPVPQSSIRPIVESFRRLTVKPGATFADIRQFFGSTSHLTHRK